MASSGTEGRPPRADRRCSGTDGPRRWRRRATPGSVGAVAPEPSRTGGAAAPTGLAAHRRLPAAGSGRSRTLGRRRLRPTAQGGPDPSPLRREPHQCRGRRRAGRRRSTSDTRRLCCRSTRPATEARERPRRWRARETPPPLRRSAHRWRQSRPGRHSGGSALGRATDRMDEAGHSAAWPATPLDSLANRGMGERLPKSVSTLRGARAWRRPLLCAGLAAEHPPLTAPPARPPSARTTAPCRPGRGRPCGAVGRAA